MTTVLTIGVAGNGAERIAEALHGFGRVKVMVIPEYLRSSNDFDIFVLNAPPGREGILNTQAAALVINSDADGILSSIPTGYAGLIITYGFNNKACVTASSVSEDTCSICVQRGFTDISGQPHNPGEFNFNCSECTPEAALAAASALMAGGVI
ncbi:MAG: hypothetical protein LBS19_00485 [Clostridiales bacterium]|jgi:hypothetical protein|nr:hypothetical protein [Clostridiales bacterium]